VATAHFPPGVLVTEPSTAADHAVGDFMPNIEYDEKGFTCQCGIRNDYPHYVQEHWSVRLVYTCACHRQYVLYRGTVTKTSKDTSEISDSEAFGD
jgi:hypothetical protein